MKIMGVDPGLHYTGIIQIEPINNDIVITYNKRLSLGNGSIEKRLGKLELFMQDIISELKPEIVALEDGYVLRKNPRSSLKIAEARGVIKAVAFNHGCLIHVHAPILAKKILTGSSKANKDKIRDTVRTLHPEINNLTEDEADAYAIAYCSLHKLKNEGGSDAKDNKYIQTRRKHRYKP